jgi:hypothetical protein
MTAWKMRNPSDALKRDRTLECVSAGRAATTLPATHYAASASFPFSSTPCWRSGLLPESLRIST